VFVVIMRTVLFRILPIRNDRSDHNVKCWAVLSVCVFNCWYFTEYVH